MASGYAMNDESSALKGSNYAIWSNGWEGLFHGCTLT
jgi:hypothetical protein